MAILTKQDVTDFGNLSQDIKNSAIEKMNLVKDFAQIPYTREFAKRTIYPFLSLNKLVGGIEVGEITIVTGYSNSGKSVFVSQIVGEIIKNDKVMCVFGESSESKTQNIIYNQFCNNQIPKIKKDYEHYGKKTNITSFFVNEEEEKKIKEMTADRLFLFDPKQTMSLHILIETIKYLRKTKNVQFFVIDNLMQIDLFEKDELKETKDNMEELRRLCIDEDLAIILVAHPKKLNERTLRYQSDDIAGTSNIANKAGTILSIVRLNSRKGTAEHAAYVKYAKSYNIDIDDNDDACVEVLKSRHNGLGIVPLIFDKDNFTFSEKNALQNLKPASIADNYNIDIGLQKIKERKLWD